MGSLVRAVARGTCVLQLQTGLRMLSLRSCLMCCLVLLMLLQPTPAPFPPGDPRAFLNPACLEEDGGHQHVQLGDQLEQFVIGKMLQSKLSLACVSGVCLPQNSVAISRNNLPRLQQSPNKLLHLVIGGIKANTTHHLLQEDQDLLV